MRQQKEIAALEALAANVAPPPVKPFRTPWELYVGRVITAVHSNVDSIGKFSIEFNDEDNTFFLAAEYTMGNEFFGHAVKGAARRVVTDRRWSKLPADATVTALIEAGKALVAELDADLKIIGGAFIRAQLIAEGQIPGKVS